MYISAREQGWQVNKEETLVSPASKKIDLKYNTVGHLRQKCVLFLRQFNVDNNNRKIQ